MSTLLFKNVTLVNRGKSTVSDLLVRNGRIDRIGSILDVVADQVIDGTGLHLLPGIIDDQVHFREPGLTHKADIGSESKAAVAGGVTSFMEMPNTKPTATTQELLAQKYARAAQVSPANYSFFMGAGNDNLEEVLKTNGREVCGVKIFMGSSTGNMLVDAPDVLEALFSKVPWLIATHCEDEPLIRAGEAAAKARFGEAVPMTEHPVIRSREACLKSSSMAVALAQKYGTRLHILHISTAEETHLFNNNIPLSEKRITSEACVHHLSFNDSDYLTLGGKIKCNPAIKTADDQEAIWQALLDDRIDVIATDHAPHTIEEKASAYFQCPSGLPLVQHSLGLMLAAREQGRITIERIVEKMCHNVATLFRIEDRGFLDEGKYADLVLVDLNGTEMVSKDRLLYKCGWSPLEGRQLPGKIIGTWVNGHCAWWQGTLQPFQAGMRMLFNA